MNIITIDFETYYSADYGLKKYTTEEYIRSTQFEVIGVAVQVNDAEPEGFTGSMLETAQFCSAVAGKSPGGLAQTDP